MVKFLGPDIVFREIPNETSLAFDITNCQNCCVGCHSDFLRKDIGEPLTENLLSSFIRDYGGMITCVLFLGEGNDSDGLVRLAKVVRAANLKSALYSGRVEVEDQIYSSFDYVKVGPYVAERGPLDASSTNQVLYRMTGGEREDITYLFWKNGGG